MPNELWAKITTESEGLPTRKGDRDGGMNWSTSGRKAIVKKT